jgi:magnesium transporter
MITVVEYHPESKNQQIFESVDWRNFETKPDCLYWWDLDNPTPEETEVLSARFHFHVLAIQDCIAEIHHPKIDNYESYLYMVIHGVDPDLSKAEGFAPKELDIFLSKTYLVTYHNKLMRSIVEVMSRLKKNSPIFYHGTDFVLYSVLDVLINGYLPVFDELEDEQDRLEELIFRVPKPPLLRRILHTKRTLMLLKRTIFPQREVINHLARSESEIVQPRNQAYFRDEYDMLYRMAEMIESFRDVSTAQVEMYLSAVSNRMNEVMKVLTVAATIFGPLTVLTGIYGMNFKYMPELEWRYGYFMVLGLIVLISGSMIAYFKHKKWF